MELRKVDHPDLAAEPAEKVELRSRETEAQFTALVDLHSQGLLSLGLPAPAASRGVWELFRALPTSRQQAILADLSYSCEVLRETKPSSEFLNRGKELEFLRRYMRRNGLRSSYQDIESLIEEGDIIEIYDSTNLQVYRSWSLFKIISYSVADLLVHPFDVLYDRPSWVLRGIQNAIVAHVAPGMPLINFADFEVPPYLLNESFDGHNHAFMMTQKYLVALVDENGQHRASLCTSVAQVLTQPKQELHVSYI